METELVSTLEKIRKWLVLQQADEKIIYLLGLFLFVTWLAVLIAKKIELPGVVSYISLGILLNVELVENLSFLLAQQNFCTQELGLLVFNTLLFGAAITELFGSLAAKHALYGAGEAQK